MAHRATGVLRRLARALPPRAVSHPPVTTGASTSCATPGSWTPTRWLAMVQANELRVGQIIGDGSLLQLTKVSYTQAAARRVTFGWREERAHRPEAVAAAVTLGRRQGCALRRGTRFLFQAAELVLMHPKTRPGGGEGGGAR